MSRKSEWQKTAAHVLKAHWNSNKALAHELASRRGSLPNLEPALSKHLNGKSRASHVLLGVENMFFDNIVAGDYPHSIFQWWMDAIDAHDASCRESENGTIAIFLDSERYLDEIPLTDHPRGTSMRNLMKGVACAIKQYHKGVSREKRTPLTRAEDVKVGVDSLIAAIEGFRIPKPFHHELGPVEHVHMAYAADMALWLAEEAPSDEKGENILLKQTREKIIKTGAMMSMSWLAKISGSWSRLYNNSRFLESANRLEDAEKAYIAAININPRLAEFGELATKEEMIDGELKQRIVDGLQEPIEADGVLIHTIARLKRKERGLLERARAIYSDHRKSYLANPTHTIPAMTAQMVRPKWRVPVDKRRAQGAMFVVIAAVFLCLGSLASHVPGRQPVASIHEARGPVFPLMVAVGPVFPLTNSAAV